MIISAFNKDDFTHRYQFNPVPGEVIDNNYPRTVKPRQYDDGPVLYRLVNKKGDEVYVRVADVFDEETAELIYTRKPKHDPRDFSHNYVFDFIEGRVFKKKSNLELKLRHNSDGSWPHFLLINNDGKRARLSQTAIKKFGGKEVYNVDVPAGFREFDMFPGLAFGPQGEVVRVTSTEPLLHPQPLTTVRYGGTQVYNLISASNKKHKLTKRSIINLFQNQPQQDHE